MVLIIPGFFNSTRTASSRPKTGKAMMERTGCWLTGMARRAPDIVYMALFSAASNLEVHALLLQTGAQYSAAKRMRAFVERHSVCSSSHCDASKVEYRSGI